MSRIRTNLEKKVTNAYCLLLVYKPLFTREQVEQHMHDKIAPVLKKNDLEIVRSSYCDNKMFAFTINHHKSGHYACIGFTAPEDKKKLINNITLNIRDMNDLLRFVVCKTHDIDYFIKTISEFDTYAEEKMNELQ